MSADDFAKEQRTRGVPEYHREGNYFLEADNMQWIDSALPRYAPGTPKKCEWAGCEEITIFGMCSPHARESQEKMIEELVKQGWKLV